MAEIEYRVLPVSPRAHRVQVQCCLPQSPPDGAVFRLAAWTPGSYKIRDFARNVLSASASSDGEAVAVEKIDKQSWRCAAVDGPVCFTIELYARENSVRGAYLDTERGMFDGAGLYPVADGYADQPCRLEIRPPEPPADHADWSLATALEPEVVDARGWGWFRARNWRELIDQPFAMGRIRNIEFEVASVPHRIALIGGDDADAERLQQDVAATCAQHVSQMQHMPARRYLFLLYAGARADGGLEHAEASTLIAERSWLPTPNLEEQGAEYRRLLGLVSHEYFHLWNVKRIRPARLTEASLLAEAYSEDLWAYEGVTSYIDDWTLRQAGLLSVPQYLEVLGNSLTRLQRIPGRMNTSLASSSFDAWIGLYQAGENAINQTVSYYLKGSLVALALDLMLRRDSDGELSLITILRDLYGRYRADGAALPDRALEQAVADRCGDRYQAFFDACVRGTDEPDFESLFADFAIETVRRAPGVLDDAGGREAEQQLRCDLGLRLQAGGMLVSAVESASAAEHAGLQPQDELLAWNGQRLDRNRLERLLRESEPGKAVRLHLFREGQLREIEIHPQRAPRDCWVLRLAGAANDEALARRAAWLSP